MNETSQNVVDAHHSICVYNSEGFVGGFYKDLTNLFFCVM